MNYLIIDLEMCKVPKHYRNSTYKYALEIIQMGAVLLDEDYQEIATLNQYVHPEHGVIDHFISDLTGINNYNVKNAPVLKDALKHMINWIGEREYKIMAWSETDRSQLLHEITNKGILDRKIDEFMDESKWIDYQAVFSKRFEFGRAVGLEEALLLCDIEIDGRLHDGLCDALNTAKIVDLLEKNANFKIKQCEYTKEVQSEPLNFSMGDLFAGLNLQFADA